MGIDCSNGKTWMDKYSLFKIPVVVGVVRDRYHFFFLFLFFFFFFF